MKRKQTRFSTEKEILDAIDDAHQRADLAIQSAKELEESIRGDQIQIARCEEIAESTTSTEMEVLEATAHARALEIKIRDSRADIEKLQKRASNLVDRRCKRLGSALSAFRTAPMEQVLGNDKAVVLA